MSFRDRLLKKLSDKFDVNEDTIAEGIAQVIRGETIKEEEKLVCGEMKLVKKVTLRSPKDVLNGAIIYDAISGGELGIAPRTLRHTQSKGVEVVHRRMKVDRAIIANTAEAKGNLPDTETDVIDVEPAPVYLQEHGPEPDSDSEHDKTSDYTSSPLSISSPEEEVGNLLMLYSEEKDS